MKVNIRRDEAGNVHIWATKKISGRPYLRNGTVIALNRTDAELREDIKAEAMNCISALPTISG